MISLNQHSSFVPAWLRILLLAVLISTSTVSFSQVLNPGPAGLIQHGNGSAPYLGAPSQVVVRGNYAYVTSLATQSLSIIDVTLPGTPFEKGRVTSADNPNLIGASALAIAGDYAYVVSVSSDALVVIDISNPEKPVVKGASIFPRNFFVYGGKVAVKGNYVYVTSSSASTTALDVSIVNVTDPSNPIQVLVSGTVPATKLDYAPKNICVSGKYVYVVNYFDVSLKIIDITQPTAPKAIGTPFTNTLSRPIAIFVKDSTAYITNFFDKSLSIVKVNNGVPTAVGKITTTGSVKLAEPLSVFVDGAFAYVGSHGDNALEIINVSNPAAPVHVTSMVSGNGAILSTPQSVFVSNGNAYLTSELGNALEIVDVTKPSTPVHKGKIVSGSNGAKLVAPRAMVIKNNYAFVASLVSKSLEIIDCSDPQKPVHKASLVDGEKGADLNGPAGIVMRGDYVYIVNANVNNSGQQAVVQVVDVSNPSNPVPVGKLLSNFPGSGIAITDSYIYILSNGPSGQIVLKVIDISSPANLTVKDSLTTNLFFGDVTQSFGKYNSIAVAGQYAYVIGSSALQIIDINTIPLASSIKSTFYSNLNGASSISVSGNYAYVASYGANMLEIINVSAASAPTHAAFYQNAAYINGPICTTVVGNYAYVGNYSGSSLEVVDVSVPTAPKHYRNLANGQNGAIMAVPNNIVVSGDYAYVLNNSSSMQILYLYSPSISSFTPTTGAENTVVTITGENLDSFLGVSFNGVDAKPISVSGTTATVKVPAAAKIGKIIINDHSPSIPTTANFIVTPSALAPTTIQQTSFTANWSDVGAANYLVDVSTDGFVTFFGAYNGISVGTVTSFTFSGLLQGKTYQYRVRSSDGLGNSDYSNSRSATTLPVTPTAEDASNISQTGFTINWTSAPGATSYFVDVAYDSAFSNFVVGYNNLIVTSAAATSQVVTGLNSYTKCYFRVRAASSSGSSPSSNIISVTTLDIAPPSIISSSTPNPVKITLGNTPVLNVNITDNVSVANVDLFYRGISQGKFKSASMQGPGGAGGNYSITLQTDWYDSLGIEYYFEAKDQAKNKSTNASAFIQLVTPSLSVPALPSGSTLNDYRIIAFPYQLATDNKITTVYNNVPWSDHTKSGLWWWNPILNNGSGDYDQYTPTGNLQNIEPGKGYWVITRSPVSTTLSNVPAPKYNQSNLYSMVLKPGWNEIGNPYPVPISWDKVIAHNQKNNPGASFGPLTIYDEGGYKPATGNTLLSAFEGGFVKNLGSSDIAIEIPFPQQNIGGRVSAISSDISAENWNMFLHIDQDGRVNRLGGFGMHRLAKAGVDRYDNFNPPSFLDIPEVSFTNEGYPSQSFSNDMVQSQDAYTWSFAPSGKEGIMAQLVWNNELNTNSSKQLFLSDEEQLTVTDMNAVNQYDFVLTKQSNFRIFFGSDVKITTSKIAAGSPFPNPMNDEGKVTINIGLPESASDYSVNLQIYNTMGNVIGSLSERRTPGIHPLEFTLPPSLAEGIYIYKLAVTNGKTSSIHTGKIVKP